MYTAPGSGTAGQGYSGGNGVSGGVNAAGGGGGKTVNGIAGKGGQGGRADGDYGTTNHGLDGLGGGGGGGSGGTPAAFYGGRGGPGIVIVRYVSEIPGPTLASAANVSDITTNSAWLVGSLVSTSHSATAVTAFLGTADGGDNIASWEHGALLGSALEPGNLTVNYSISGNATPGTDYTLNWLRV